MKARPVGRSILRAAQIRAIETRSVSQGQMAGYADFLADASDFDFR
jgi:hypothetical protein